MKTTKRFLCFIMALMFLPLANLMVSAKRKPTRPKVSVIVPVYKVEPWIRECADSLVNQTLKEIEIIFVDDGSPDNCGKILDEYAKKYKTVKVIHKKNGGVQRARNTGIDAARGEYLAFVDSDDYVERNAYETAYKLAKKDNVDILAFGQRRFKEGHDRKRGRINASDRPVISIQKFAKNGLANNVWNKLYKSEIIKKDNVKFIPGVRPADDTCFFYMTVGRAKKIKKIPARFYNYRIRPGSLARMSRMDIFLNSRQMIKLICDDWKKHGLYKSNEHILLTILVKWIRQFYKISDNPKYAAEMLNSLGKDVYNPKIVSKCPKQYQDYISALKHAANIKA